MQLSANGFTSKRVKVVVSAIVRSILPGTERNGMIEQFSKVKGVYTFLGSEKLTTETEGNLYGPGIDDLM